MIEIIHRKLNKSKQKKKKEISSYRDNKLGVHTTINGKGYIARIK
jgi:hypothetical protein